LPPETRSRGAFIAWKEAIRLFAGSSFVMKNKKTTLVDQALRRSEEGKLQARRDSFREMKLRS